MSEFEKARLNMAGLICWEKKHGDDHEGNEADECPECMFREGWNAALESAAHAIHMDTEGETMRTGATGQRAVMLVRSLRTPPGGE